MKHRPLLRLRTLVVIERMIEAQPPEGASIAWLKAEFKDAFTRVDLNHTMKTLTAAGIIARSGHDPIRYKLVGGLEPEQTEWLRQASEALEEMRQDTRLAPVFRRICAVEHSRNGIVSDVDRHRLETVT